MLVYFNMIASQTDDSEGIPVHIKEELDLPVSVSVKYEEKDASGKYIRYVLCVNRPISNILLVVDALLCPVISSSGAPYPPFAHSVQSS